MRALLGLIFAFVLGSNAFAGDLTVSVRDNSGRAIRDAVVTVRPDAGVPRGPIRFPWALRIAQQDLQFQPYVLIAPVGQPVAFPNLDRVRHQVYSFSRGNRFEIELFGRDQTRSHTFAAPASPRWAATSTTRCWPMCGSSIRPMRARPTPLAM